MLSVGWPEMMIIAAAALIIVGPRDLPALLRTVGRVVGQARRMGNDFRRELNKVAAIDEVRDIKQSIAQPLTQSRREIESEFNRITPNGVEPSGALKPADPGNESVYDEIKAATANIREMPDPAVARDSMAAAVKRGQQNIATRKAVDAEQPATAAPETAPKPKPGKAAAKPKAAPARKAADKTVKPAVVRKPKRTTDGGDKPAKSVKLKAASTRKTAAKQTADRS